jgi:hypothetical protein
MKHARWSLAVAGFALLIAAAVAWYRFAPGEAPAGQPPLVTIDAKIIEDLRADFNRHSSDTRVIVLLSPT